MEKKQLYFTVAITWFIVTVVLLTLPGSAFPQEDWLDKIWFDKWVHIGLFAGLVFLWCLYITTVESKVGKLKNIFISITLAGIVYGTAMEFVQKYWIPHRSFDTGDIAADAAGCLMALAWCSRKYIKK